MKQLIVLSSLKDLGKVAQINEKFMRVVAADSRRKKDFFFANRADLEARKWRKVATHAVEVL